MAKRRTLDRKALRDQNEAAARKKSKEKDELEEEEDEEEEEEDEESDDDASDSDDDDDGESKPKKKKKAKKAVVAKKKTPAKRTRTPKIVRMKVVWAVYSNSHALLQEFPYPKKKDAEHYLEKITNDKKSGGPFFIQLFKKPMEVEAPAETEKAKKGK
jgi:hypothetical protein